jgi:hypothetical protein
VPPEHKVRGSNPPGRAILIGFCDWMTSSRDSGCLLVNPTFRCSAESGLSRTNRHPQSLQMHSLATESRTALPATQKELTQFPGLPWSHLGRARRCQPIRSHRPPRREQACCGSNEGVWLFGIGLHFQRAAILTNVISGISFLSGSIRIRNRSYYADVQNRDAVSRNLLCGG